MRLAQGSKNKINIESRTATGNPAVFFLPAKPSGTPLLLIRIRGLCRTVAMEQKTDAKVWLHTGSGVRFSAFSIPFCA